MDSSRVDRVLALALLSNLDDIGPLDRHGDDETRYHDDKQRDETLRRLVDQEDWERECTAFRVPELFHRWSPDAGSPRCNLSYKGLRSTLDVYGNLDWRVWPRIFEKYGHEKGATLGKKGLITHRTSHG